MNKRVTLVARDIQVTASNQEQALSYLRDDAFQFSGSWNYDEDEVADTTDDLTEDGDEAELDVEVDTPKGRGERLWTGNATFTVIVDASDESGAFAAARALLAA